MFDELLKNGLPAWLLLVVAAGLFLYMAATVWTHLEISSLFWQNLFRSNKVALPEFAQKQAVPVGGTEESQSTALVLSRTVIPVNQNLNSGRSYENIILPVAGRNGLNFNTERCTSCGLCAYVCPTKAVTTQSPEDSGYTRQFDLEKCIYCGLCEAACPTWAIKLTVNEQPAQTAGAVVAGKVAFAECKECGRQVPQADLLADRIYELDNPTWQGKATKKLADHLRQAVQPEGICTTCQKQVLEAEERICG